MKYKGFLGIIMILTVMIFSSVLFAQAKIDLPQTEFDFGYVPQESTISHVFWIKSVGLDTLRILEVRPGCGCTKAPIKKKEISSGDSTELEIIYSSGHRLGESVKHPLLKVNSNPVDHRLTIKATTLREPNGSYPAIFKPYRVYVSRAGEIEVTEGKFKIINVSPDLLELNVVSQSRDYFDLDLPENIRPGDTAVCKLKVKPEKLGEEFHKSFTIEFNDPQKTRFSIPVVRRFIGVKSPE